MNELDKTKEELINELKELRKRLTGFEAVEGEHQQIEAALRESENRFRILFEQAGDALFLIQPDGRFIDVNKRACEALGYSRKELLTLSVPDIDPVYPQDAFEKFYLTLKKGKPVTIEVVHKRRNGTTFPVEIRTGLIDIRGDTCLFSLARDITKRKSAEQALRGEKDRAEKYLNVAGVMFVIINADQTVGLINRKGCKILGYKENEIIGKNWFDTFIPGNVRKEVKSVFDKLMSGEIKPVEYFENTVLTKRGEEKIISWHNTVLEDDAGNITGTLSSGEDITQRKRADEEREKLINELQDALVEIKSLKVMIPLCALHKRGEKEAIKEHYNHVKKDGKCPECIRLLRK